LIQCSSRANPYLTRDFISSLEDQYSGVFLDQELEGKFVGLEGLVYGGFDRTRHVVTDWVLKHKHGHFVRFVASCDFGWMNPMALLVFGVDSDDRLYAIDEIYKRKLMMSDFVEVCRDMRKKYKIEAFYCDPSEPEHIHQLRVGGLNALQANNDVLAGINSVASRLEFQRDGRARLYVHERCVNLLSEFENYAYPDPKKHQNTDPPNSK